MGDPSLRASRSSLRKADLHKIQKTSRPDMGTPLPFSSFARARAFQELEGRSSLHSQFHRMLLSFPIGRQTLAGQKKEIREVFFSVATPFHLHIDVEYISLHGESPSTGKRPLTELIFREHEHAENPSDAPCIPEYIHKRLTCWGGGGGGGVQTRKRRLRRCTEDWVAGHISAAVSSNSVFQLKYSMHKLYAYAQSHHPWLRRTEPKCY